MKNKFKIIFSITIVSILLTNCKSEDTFSDGIFNDNTNYPYVSIQDRNEPLDGNVGNNFWNFIITSENEGNQIRISYDSQDPNITSHEIIVGRDSANNPPNDGVVIGTINSFPTELVITKADLAAALNEPIENFNSGSVWFGGRSIDADNHVVDDPANFEVFLTFERHAYDYRWILN